MSTHGGGKLGAMALVVMACIIPAWAQRPMGLDVSVYTPLTQADWNNIRNSGRTFAFARASYGWGGVDTQFVNHMTRGKAAGLYMGAYHFEYAGYDSNHTPTAEAISFLNVARPYIAAGYLRPVLDVEYVGSSLNGLTLTQWCTQWMDYVEQQTGVEPLIYCNLPWANQLDSSIKTRDLWWAAWPTNPDPQTGNPSTDGWATWRFWQYAGDVTIPGVTTQKVDLNVFNGTSTTLLNYVIDGGGQISRSPTSLTSSVEVNSTAPAQTFTIWNSGSNTLSFAVASNVSWATVSPTSGTSTGAGDAVTITVSYTVNALAIGTYTGAITITAAGATNSPQTVPLTMNITAIPGDLDADGDIDVSDVPLFQACMTGSSVTQTDEHCLTVDFDHDQDVDQADFGVLQKCLSGPAVPADPNCSK